MLYCLPAAPEPRRANMIVVTAWSQKIADEVVPSLQSVFFFFFNARRVASLHISSGCKCSMCSNYERLGTQVSVTALTTCCSDSSL